MVSVDFRRRRREDDDRWLIVSEETGRPYLADNFRHVFRDVCIKAQERHPHLPLGALRFCWLRHTAVTRMAEADCKMSEIAAITGHTLGSVVAIIEHYLVRTKKMARSAFRKRLEHLAAEGYEII